MLWLDAIGFFHVLDIELDDLEVHITSLQVVS